MSKVTQLPPKPTTCHVCGVTRAQAICSNCGTERPAYTAVKRLSETFRAAVAPRCHYDKDQPCLAGCNGRGVCLPAA